MGEMEVGFERGRRPDDGERVLSVVTFRFSEQGEGGRGFPVALFEMGVSNTETGVPIDERGLFTEADGGLEVLIGRGKIVPFTSEIGEEAVEVGEAKQGMWVLGVDALEHVVDELGGVTETAAVDFHFGRDVGGADGIDQFACIEEGVGGAGKGGDGGGEIAVLPVDDGQQGVGDHFPLVFLRFFVCGEEIERLLGVADGGGDVLLNNGDIGVSSGDGGGEDAPLFLVADGETGRGLGEQVGGTGEVRFCFRDAPFFDEGPSVIGVEHRPVVKNFFWELGGPVEPLGDLVDAV